MNAFPKTTLAILSILFPVLGNANDVQPINDAYIDLEYTGNSKVPDFYTESLKTRDTRVQWWKDARFGCFIHWGAYSALGGVWQGEPVSGYAEHIQRKCKIDQATYRSEVIEKFNPVKFNADEWVRQIKAAGMGYLVITAKHHDGFAMYDSAVSEWDIIDASPFKRDPMAELRDACRKHGIRFGFYYSHAFDWGDPNGPGNDWEFKNPGGDTEIGGRRGWFNDPVVGKEIDRIRREYVDKKSIPQVQELALNYQPDIMWFDTPHKLPPSENWRIYKALRQVAPDAVVNSRILVGSIHGDYRSTCDKPAEIKRIAAPYWEAIPTTNESYGYHGLDKSHKPSAELIQLLVKAVARGGNILMNLGPRGDGTFDAPDVKILQDFSVWMKLASESIHGADESGLPVQAWGESTRKGNTVYLHVFDWPQDGKLRVGGLKSSPAQIRVMGSDGEELSATRLNDTTLEINVPANPIHPADTVIALSFEGDIETAEARFLDPTQPTRLSVFDGNIEGRDLRTGAGDSGWSGHRNDCLKNWTQPTDSIRWTRYVNSPTTYDVTVIYHAKTGDNTLRLKLGDTSLTAQIQPGQDQEIRMGTLTIHPGIHQLSLHAEGELDGMLEPSALLFQPVVK
jgi:alpha-L-fucosidase